MRFFIERISVKRFNEKNGEADKAKRRDLRGISGRFGAAVGAPMAVGV